MLSISEHQEFAVPALPSLPYRLHVLISNMVEFPGRMSLHQMLQLLLVLSSYFLFFLLDKENFIGWDEKKFIGIDGEDLETIFNF